MALGGQVGLKQTYLALLDENRKLVKGEQGLTDDGLYVSNSHDQGTASANISNLGAAGEAKYGDNGMVSQSKAKSFPQVAGVWNALPFDVKQKLLGRESDGKGGYVDSTATTNAALIVETETLDRQASIYYAFSAGEFFEPGSNIQTDNQTSQEVTDALTYQSFGDDRWNGQGIKIFYSRDEGFKKEDMLKEVMGGYVASSPQA